MSIDYKNIIKSRNLRLKILRILRFIPDKLMLKLQYRIKTGHRLNLKNPQRFTEKLQWYKLYYKDSKMIKCVDKYDVREYVKSKGLGDILIPCYGVYDSINEVDWDGLPNQFVMKDTLGGGGTSVVIVKDKTSADIDYLKETASKWTNIKAHQKDAGREWPYYSGKKHRILFEKYIDFEDENKHGLLDYKFFCFNGRAEFIYVMGDRNVGDKVSVSIFNRDFKRLKVKRVGDNALPDIQKPHNFSEMCQTAEILSQDFPHVRVDLYNNKGKINFGELTFYNASGYMKYEPDKFDYLLGSKFKI